MYQYSHTFLCIQIYTGPHFSSASPIASILTNVTSDEKLYTFYKLVCSDQNIKEVFVGYTLSKLKTVLTVHKNKYENTESGECNRRIYQIVRATGGWENWYVYVYTYIHKYTYTYKYRTSFIYIYVYI
jgi:hypothetical protein